MKVEGKADTFELVCTSCQRTDLTRGDADTPFADFAVECPECGGRAVVEDDAGIVKAYPLDSASIECRID